MQPLRSWSKRRPNGTRPKGTCRDLYIGIRTLVQTHYSILASYWCTANTRVDNIITPAFHLIPHNIKIPKRTLHDALTISSKKSYLHKLPHINLQNCALSKLHLNESWYKQASTPVDAKSSLRPTCMSLVSSVNQ